MKVPEAGEREAMLRVGGGQGAHREDAGAPVTWEGYGQGRGAWNREGDLWVQTQGA